MGALNDAQAVLVAYWAAIVEAWHRLYDMTVSVTFLIEMLLFIAMWNVVMRILHRRKYLTEGQLKMARKRTVLRQGAEKVCDFVEDFVHLGIWSREDANYFYRTVSLLGLPDLKPRRKPYPPYLKKLIKERIGKKDRPLAILEGKRNKIAEPKVNGRLSEIAERLRNS